MGIASAIVAALLTGCGDTHSGGQAPAASGVAAAGSSSAVAAASAVHPAADRPTAKQLRATHNGSDGKHGASSGGSGRHAATPLSSSAATTAGEAGGSSGAGKGPRDHPEPFEKILYARCGVDGFDRQGSRGKYSALVWYSRPGSVPKHMPHPKIPKGIKGPDPDSLRATLSVIISESSPRRALPPSPKGKGETRNIGGRDVTFTTAAESENGNAYVAEWKTGQAGYTAVANGVTEDDFMKVIGCMP